ncbi:hypothetical protein QZQ97_02000 [Serratia sp. root2]|uniref:hypothetical protein n=1 Tax=Serratia sp. root2 TaxID=3059676 RepID=UPI00288E8DA5|nr:hypothetical protein [Serratia sp. root2]MDT3249696.1 hypothetical protein [Serratia sp. root2]
MTIYRMPALTAEEIRSIGEKAVADVARQKITTTKVETSGALKSQENRHAKGRKAVHHKVSNGLVSPGAARVQKSLAGSALSQSEGRNTGASGVQKSLTGSALSQSEERNMGASGVQKSLAGSVLSQSEGRNFFKEAFNKARKG